MIKKEKILESGIERRQIVKDRVVILEHDGRMAEILTVEDINEERILIPGYSIPWQDTKEYISPEGRVFVVNAPEDYIKETKHLASVEMSTVIKHAVQYERMKPEKVEFSKFMPWIVVLLMAFMLVVKK